jgi:hypothetical protein
VNELEAIIAEMRAQIGESQGHEYSINPTWVEEWAGPPRRLPRHAGGGGCG